MRLKISFGKCRPSCLGLNVLKQVRTYIVAIRSDRSWPLLLQIMAFRRLGVKPFPKTTETYCQLNHLTNFKGYLHKNIRIQENPFEILSAKGTFVSTGPFHWQFFHHNSNSMEISFSCKSNYWYRNRYISHGRTAVVPCAKFCSDHFIKMWMRVWWNFHHIWIVMEKFVSELGSTGLNDLTLLQVITNPVLLIHSLVNRVVTYFSQRKRKSNWGLFRMLLGPVVASRSGWSTGLITMVCVLCGVSSVWTWGSLVIVVSVDGFGTSSVPWYLMYNKHICCRSVFSVGTSLRNNNNTMTNRVSFES